MMNHGELTGWHQFHQIFRCSANHACRCRTRKAVLTKFGMSLMTGSQCSWSVTNGSWGILYWTFRCLWPAEISPVWSRSRRLELWSTKNTITVINSTHLTYSACMNYIAWIETTLNCTQSTQMEITSEFAITCLTFQNRVTCLQDTTCLCKLDDVTSNSDLWHHHIAHIPDNGIQRDMLVCSRCESCNRMVNSAYI